MKDKSARIQLQGEQLEASRAEIDRLCRKAEAREIEVTEEMNHVEAELELRIRERVADLQREVNQANSALDRVVADAERSNGNHKKTLESTRAAMGKDIERAVDERLKAQAALALLRSSVTQQLAEVEKKVHQAESALNTVRQWQCFCFQN